jgi:hypothetical protein
VISLFGTIVREQSTEAATALAVSLILPGNETTHESILWHRFLAIVGTEFPTQVRPFLVEARSPDGKRSPWVLKPRSRLGCPGSCIELAAARFAHLLGVKVPEAAVIDVRESDVRLLGSMARDQLLSTVGPNFGSKYLEGLDDLKRPNDVAPRWKDDASSIYGFDVACDNADRTDSAERGFVRSNVLLGDDGLWAIDHQYAFAWYVQIPRGGPVWREEMAARARAEHFLRTVVVPRGSSAWQAMRYRLEAITPEQIANVTANMPAAWLQEGGQQCLSEIETFLRDVVTRSGEVVDAIERRLER